MSSKLLDFLRLVELAIVAPRTIADKIDPSFKVTDRPITTRTEATVNVMVLSYSLVNFMRYVNAIPARNPKTRDPRISYSGTAIDDQMDSCLLPIRACAILEPEL